MTAAAVVAAANARTRRRMLAELREKGALSPMTATSLSVPGRRERRMLERLTRHGVVVQVGPDRFYLDEAQLALRDAAMARTRLVLISVIAVATLSAAVVAFLLGHA
jgi:hypothetical protein